MTEDTIDDALRQAGAALTTAWQRLDALSASCHHEVTVYKTLADDTYTLANRVLRARQGLPLAPTEAR